MVKLILCSLLFLSVVQAQNTDCKNDWPNLARYDKDNQAVAPPAKNEQRVVFMGDSITQLWGLAAPQDFGPARVNRGISGQTTPQMLLRFKQDVLALKPKAVHILAGINDIGARPTPTAEALIAGYRQVIARAHAHGLKVILGTVVP